MSEISEDFAENCDQICEKSSFNRFGSDLSELILSYLSVSDKLTLECLSKHTRSLIFNKQKSIIISNNYVNYGNNSSVNHLLTQNQDFKRLFNIEKQLFAELLSKFRSIEELTIDNYCIIDGQILRLIADNCQNLRKFVCTSIKCNGICDEDLEHFGHKMSKTLESIQFDCLPDIQLNQLLKLIKNSVRTVSIENNNFCVRNDSVFLDLTKRLSDRPHSTTDCSPKLLPKLRSIFITCYSVEDIQRLADYYSKDLIKIQIRFMSNQKIMGNVMNACLKQLSRFVNIRSLTLLIYNYQKGFISPIDEGLILIGRNCPKLKYFICEMTRNLISSQLFDVFADYPALNTCKISTTYENQDSYGTIEGLKNWKQLKHLTLYLKYLSDKHFLNIESVLPNLRSFKVNTSDGYLTDRTVDSLSKLSHLSDVEISGSSSSLVNITDQSVSALVANCPHIRTVSLFCKTSVGKPTVDQFITTAKQYPKNTYKYFFEFSQPYDEDSYEELDSGFISYQSVPENLLIYQI